MVIIFALIVIFAIGQILGGIAHTADDSFPWDDFRHM